MTTPEPTPSANGLIVLRAELYRTCTSWRVDHIAPDAKAMADKIGCTDYYEDWPTTPAPVLGEYGSWVYGGKHSYLWWPSGSDMQYYDHKATVYRVRPYGGGWRGEVLLGLQHLLPRVVDLGARELTQEQVDMVLHASARTSVMATPKKAADRARHYIDTITAGAGFTEVAI